MPMGRRYAVRSNSTAVASPTVTPVGVQCNAGATIRPWIYDVILGSSATPADNAILWKAQRYTVAGAGTAYTPAPLDPGDPASFALAFAPYTTEPTYTAATFLLWIALNQRATHRWIADPNGPLLITMTAANGIGIFPVHSSCTGAADVTAHFAE